MTTPYTIPPIWAGCTVAIFGTAPGMSAQLAESVRQHKTIAVSRAVAFAPWADMFVALDPYLGSWPDVADFAGLKICGVACDDVDALYAGMFYEDVAMPQGHTLQIRNNALAAMRIAAQAGAAKIIMLGFDAARYDAVHAHTGFSGFTEGLAQVTAQLQAQGIVVEFAEMLATPANPTSKAAKK